MLLYADESEALTHPYLARAWAERGADLRVPAPGQAKKVAMMGSLDHVKRRLIVHTSRTRRSADFIAHLEELDRLFGPKPGRETRPVVLVEETGQSMSARPRGRRWRPRALADRRVACPNTRPNSMTSRSSGTTSRHVTSPIRRSPMPKRSIAKSTRRSKL